MKVQYKCTFERVNETIAYAKQEDIEIDFIELCPKEWFIFHKKAGGFLTMSNYFENEVVYQGVSIRKKMPS